MAPYDEGVPQELREVAERLRADRHAASALELDAIKTRAMQGASRSRPKGFALMKSRGVTALLTLALMAGGTGGVIAATSGGTTTNNASNSQYKPGCGPKKTDGVNPSGTHTGPPGQGDTNRESCPK